MPQSRLPAQERFRQQLGIDDAQRREPPIRALVEMNEHDVAVIMDLVVGPSLATLVNARTWLEPAEIATVWHGIADALAAMHHRGLVHGDVVVGSRSGHRHVGGFFNRRDVKNSVRTPSQS